MTTTTALYLAYCPACECFARLALAPLADTEQTAGEHDHQHHQGEPTATVHRATEEDR